MLAAVANAVVVMVDAELVVDSVARRTKEESKEPKHGNSKENS